MKSLQEYIVENIVNIFEKRDNKFAMDNPGLPKDKNGNILSLESGSYWWKDADSMINDLKEIAGKNLKKLLQNNDFIEAIKKCYEDNVKDIPTYKNVPFVIKIVGQNNKNINPSQIFIRRNVTYKESVKNLLNQYGIYKEGSGFGKSAGSEYEDDLSDAIQLYIIDKYINDFKDIPHLDNSFKEFIDKLFTKLKSKYEDFEESIKKFINDNNTENIIWYNKQPDGKQIGYITNIVCQTGGTNTKRNNKGQIFDNDTMSINYTKGDLSSKEESKISKIIKDSGEIISDITIYPTGKNTKNDIYLSIKCGKSQISGINIRPPFYGNKIIPALPSSKDNKESFLKNNIAFNNLCKLFSIDKNIVFDYFVIDDDKRSDKLNIDVIDNQINDDSSEILTALLLLIIGGNYWYVNSDGTIKYIPYNLKELNNNNVPFKVIWTNDAWLTRKSINRKARINFNNEYIEATLTFRTSDSDHDYPYRLFWNMSEHWIDKLFPDL